MRAFETAISHRDPSFTYSGQWPLKVRSGMWPITEHLKLSYQILYTSTVIFFVKEMVHKIQVSGFIHKW